MAATSASRSWSTLAGRGLAVGAAAALALIALATPASAHVPSAKAACVGKKTVLTVKAVKYDANVTNTVTVVEKADDGQEPTTIVDTTFKTDFELKKDDFDPTVAHAFKVSIKAENDPDGRKGWTKDFDLKVDACKDKPSTPPSSPPSSSNENPPSSSAPVANPPATTPTTEAPVGANANLAATGASIAIPLGIGGLLLAGGATMLFILRRRRRA